MALSLLFLFQISKLSSFQTPSLLYCLYRESSENVKLELFPNSHPVISSLDFDFEYLKVVLQLIPRISEQVFGIINKGKEVIINQNYFLFILFVLYLYFIYISYLFFKNVLFHKY